MKPFCEVVVTTVLPAIRSIITRQLMDNYKFTQQQTADLLGLTQPAVSQYVQQSRGVKVKILEKQPEIMTLIDDLTKDVATGKLRPKELQSKFCTICKTIRKKRIICYLHEQVYPSIVPCSECIGEC